MLTHINIDELLTSENFLLGYTCGQIFIRRFGYLRCVPISNKGDVQRDLLEEFQYVGVTTDIHADNERD